MPTIKIEYSLDSLGDITPAEFRDSCERRAGQLGYDVEFSEGLHNRETVDGEAVDLITEQAFSDCCQSAPRASYTITSHNGELIARDDETGEIVARVISDTVITASTDSDGVIAEFGPALVGDVIGADHDGDSICVEVSIPARIGISE